MKTKLDILMVIALLTMLLGVTASPVAAQTGSTIAVTTFAQSPGGAGDCTLGEAIQAANTDVAVDGCPAGSGADTISLPAGQYDLSAAAEGSGNTAAGLPYITSDITIVGELDEVGQPASIINRTSTAAGFRLLQVQLGAGLALQYVKLSGGSSLTYYGGAIYSEGTLSLADSTLDSNAALIGGAIHSRAGYLDVVRCVFTNNTADMWGGVIDISETAALSIEDSTFSNNTAANAGAVEVSSSGTNAISGSLFADNTTEYSGGALRIITNVTIVNSTFTGNTVTGALGQGGAVNVDADGAEAILTNVTMSGNSADWGGNLNVYHGNITLNNSILANPATGTSEAAWNLNCMAWPATDRPATVTDGGGNVRTPEACANVTTFLVGYPEPQALADNGGSTQTMALGLGSAALQIGVPANCPATDQRGTARPQPSTSTACDAGAFESDLPVPLVVGPDEIPDGEGGTAYEQQFTAGGGTAPYAFIVSDGALPAGLTLSEAGLLSGTPTEAGSFAFTVKVTDATNAGFGYYALDIVQPLLDGTFDFTADPNPSAEGQEVAFTLSATGDAVHPDLGPVPPIGIVQFYADGNPIAGCESVYLNLDVGLMMPGDYPAVCTTSALTPGVHEIAARYYEILTPPLYRNVERILNQTVQSLSISISPASAMVGSDDLALTVDGSNFTADSVVLWNGTELATTFINAGQLTAVVPAESLTPAQTAQVSVSTSGSTSNVLAFFVTEATTAVTAQDAASGTDPSASVDTATATATGDGLLVVAEYDASPAETPSFNVSGSYFDVYIAPDNSFSQVEIVACGLTVSDKLTWWNGTGWVKASPQTYADGCVTLVVTDSSSPSLGQLQGTYFVSGIESNTAPIANPGGPYLAPINTAILFDGSGSSDADGDTLTYAWTFYEGDTAGGTGATPTHSYADPAVYNVCLTVNDGALDSAKVCTLAAVYDPDGGFVTGGGWIDSQVGAYKLDESLSGKATFGFVSKYKKGASVPEGTTEFLFQAGGFTFHSTAYDWLVVDKGGTNAQFKGSGTVNGGLDPNGNEYKFMIWATDGAPDTFRIQVWWEDADAAEHVVYDNGFNQAIGGGSIVVHTK